MKQHGSDYNYYNLLFFIEERLISKLLNKRVIRSLINHWVLSCECETQQVSILNTFSRSHLSSQLHSLFLEWNTIFEFDRLQKSQTASLHFLKCMVEYLEPGQDKQYCVHMVAIEFFDGDQEQDSRELESRKSSFR